MAQPLQHWAELQPRPENPALAGGLRDSAGRKRGHGRGKKGKRWSGWEERRGERASLGERRVEGALPFPPEKGPAASAVPRPPNPARPPFAGAEQLAVPLLIVSHRTQTKAPFQKETALDPQPGQGEMPGEGGMSWLTARGSWPGWPPRTGCRRPSAGGCSPAHPTPPTSCRKRRRMSTSVFPCTENRPCSRRASERGPGTGAPRGTGMLLLCPSNPGRRGDRLCVGVKGAAGLGGTPSAPTCFLRSSSSRCARGPGLCRSPRPASRGSPVGCKTCC